MAGDSSFKILMTREGATYLALTIPTLLIQATYSFILYNTFNLGIPPPFNLVTQPLGIAALLVVLGAIITFRPTLVMLILGLSYFTITLIPQTPTPDPLILLIPLFLLMVSFNYGRAARTAAGRKPKVSSRGPLHLKILSLSLNGLLPVAAAVVLVTIASFILNIAEAEVSILPYPLSDISFLYLQTRVGFVFFATLAAGILLWVIKEFLEPAILYYSLDKAGARQLIAEEYKDLKENFEKKFLKWRLGTPIEIRIPSRGGIVVGVILMLLLLGLYGPTPDDMLVRSGGLVKIIPGGLDGEVLVQAVSDMADYIDSNVLRLENLIRYLVSLLWGG